MTTTGDGNPPGAGPSGADRIEIRGLRADACHGVDRSERAEAQPFEVDLDLYLPLAEAAAGDDLGRSADYAEAVNVVMGVLLGPPRRLLETLAEDMARAVLAGGSVQAVTVSVRKLRPPVPQELSSAGVRLTRRRT